MSNEHWWLQDGYKFEGENDKSLIEFTKIYGDDMVDSIVSILSYEGIKYIVSGEHNVYIKFRTSETYYPTDVQNPGMIYTGDVIVDSGDYSITIISDNVNGTRIVEWFKEAK